jgi:cytochrome c-type biogenesis protein CcmH
MASPASAVRPDERLPDPGLEARAHDIGEELRCLVCQNQSIEDSDADLAHDLRLLVRERIKAGDSDEQVKQYLVARYGTYVLLKPPLNAETYALWFGPLVFLLCAIGLAAIFYRSGRWRGGEVKPLSEAERRRLSMLLDDAQSPTREI